MFFAVAGVAFLFYLIWSLRLPMDLAPDEEMRFGIPWWIFEHGRLPFGNERELVDPVWGFSYGFSPYLPSLLAVAFMKISAFFGAPQDFLLHSARFVSVLAGSGTVLLCLFIGQELFVRRETKYLFAILAGFLPQFVFLSSYLNNDCSSVFCSALILLAWIKGLKSHWDIKSSVLLGFGISLEALTYYFAYAWILCSVFLAVASVLVDKAIEKKGAFIAKRVGVVFAAFLVLAGWHFARAGILYDGDIFGRRIKDVCAEQYAEEEYKPSVHWNFKKDGKSFAKIVFNPKWHKSTINSFFAVFGYMSIPARATMFRFYFAGFTLGLALAFARCCKRNETLFKCQGVGGWSSPVFITCLALCAVIPSFLSMYYSWSWDFQAQGRYVISAILPLMVAVSCGYEFLQEKINAKFGSKIPVMLIVTAFYFAAFIFILFDVIIPRCWGL